jgi:hypothetical protein
MNTATMLPIIRHVLQIIAGILIAKGWLSDKEAADLTSAVLDLAGPAIGLGTIAWMVWDKKSKPTPTAPALIAAGLLGIALGGVGCSAILPGNDPVMVNAERTTVLAVDVFDTFLKWEYDNRIALASVPEVKKSADFIRLKAPDWLATARSMTEAYRRARTPENKANLTTALSVLQAGVRQAQRYVTADLPPAAN